MFAIARCRACGLVSQYPLPSPAKIKSFYPNVYYPDPKPPDIKPSHRLALQLYLGYPGAPAMVPARDRLSAWFRARRILAKHPFLIPYIPGGRILDVGCGAGTFLLMMQSLGWNVAGVEMNAVTAEKLNTKFSANVFGGDFLDAPFETHSFDVIFMSHMLEHVLSPSRILDKARSLLKPGGQIWIAVPNFSSVEAALFRSYWYGLDLPRHIHQFTPGTLRAYLAKAGFKRVRIRWEKSTGGITHSLANLGVRLPRFLEKILIKETLATLLHKLRLSDRMVAGALLETLCLIHAVP
ncbi:class I SAM-dependent methyltransferase [bacterium]|nr:class I SAM-dependent methyltransferase [bacterium]